MLLRGRRLWLRRAAFEAGDLDKFLAGSVGAPIRKGTYKMLLQVRQPPGCKRALEKNFIILKRDLLVWRRKSCMIRKKDMLRCWAAAARARLRHRHRSFPRLLRALLLVRGLDALHRGVQVYPHARLRPGLSGSELATVADLCVGLSRSRFRCRYIFLYMYVRIRMYTSQVYVYDVHITGICL